MALAAMDSKPVFFIEVEGDDWINAGRIEGKNRQDLGLLPDGINYLYAAPQPLTDAEREELQERRKADSETVAVVPEDVRQALRKMVDEIISELDAEESACRAAMLQAEPVTTANKLGNSPAQSPIDHGYRKGCECSGCKTTVRICAELAGNSPVIPDTWIPVSERMPEDDDFVYIWPRPDFGVELHVGQYCEFSPKGDGWYAQVYEQNYGIEWHPITVTHWMPLPAAPQEVQGE